MDNLAPAKPSIGKSLFRFPAIFLAVAMAAIQVQSQENQSPSSETSTRSAQPRFVPPGFESLLEPQTTLVDVYLAGEFLTSQMATFTAHEITFSAPQAIADRIPQLLDPAPVVEAISGSIPTNMERVCHYEGQDNCGQLSPDIASVIFNEGRFRADLFVSGNLLAVRSAGHRKYLPASDSEWSWLQTLNGAYAGTRELDSDTYSIGSHSMLAFRENRFQLSGNVSDDGERNSTIDTAALRRDWQGMEYQLGYFRSNSGSFQFMSDSPIRGLRLASSLDTREDLRQTAGNELQVFLDSRSEVLLFKDGRLVSSRFYDAGNQVLDTSQLPGGAYDVTIQIRDSAGRVDEETRFYVKSSQLPPMDQPLYFFEAGEVLDPADDSGFAAGQDLTVLRAGYHGRLGDQLGFLTGLSQVESNSSLELGVTHLGRYHDFSVGGFTGNDDRRGARLNLRARLSSIYVNANYRRVWNDNFDPDDPSDLFGASASQASLGITSLLPVGRVELSGRYNRRLDDAVETYTARYEFPRLRLGGSEMLMGFQLSREEGQNTGLFTLSMRLSSEHFTAQLQPEYRSRSSGGTSTDTMKQGAWQTDGVLSWQDRQLLPDQDLRIDLRGRNQQDLSGFGAEMDYASRNGRLRLQAERTRSGGNTLTRYNGNGFTSFMVNQQSAKLGGRDQTQSALLVEIDGDLQDATFDVMVDGNPRGTAYPNHVTAINLRPYETYKVTLRQRGSSFVEYDQGSKEVTLYPGNVVTLGWKVAELHVVFGRILDENQQAIPNALIKGVAGIATTDEFGLFQAELRSDIETLQLETVDATCELTVPQYEIKQSIGNLGSLSCTLTPKEEGSSAP